MILTLARRELRGLFVSPLAWAILAAVQLVLAYVFLLQIDQYLRLEPQLNLIPNAPGATDLAIGPLFIVNAFVCMFVIPLLGMRLLSEERRNATLSLLFSAPISMTEIVLGKYLGLLGFLAIMLVLIMLMPLSLLLAGHIDLGQIAAMLLGFCLLSAAFAALSLFMSSLTEHPAVAAISSIGALLFLWLVGLSDTGIQQHAAGNVLSYLSILGHFQPFARGVVSTTDIAYYLLLIAVFLLLSIRRLDAQRLQK